MHASALHPAISPSVRFDGRYDIIEYLGGGNFGEVWKANDSTTGRFVALKLIDPASTTPDDAWQEATHLTSLASANGSNSPFLVPVHGAALSGLGVPYIDMALISGGSLRAKCEPYGVDEATAVKWAQRVARGLHLCHDRRLLHRDVKADNVLLSQTGDALLGDFGVTAVMAPDGTAAEHGDVHIRAPEVFGGRCSVRSDVYSLGILLHFSLVGRYPYRLSDYGNELQAFEAAVRRGVLDIRETAPHLSLGVARIVRQATAFDPGRRYRSAAEFDSALAGLNPPRRVIREVSPCHPEGRCWDANPAERQALRPVHVATSPQRNGKIEIDTRHVGGQRLVPHCATVSAGQSSARLRSVFRAML